MATDAVLDLEPLLAPIVGSNPAGRHLVYEAEYDELNEARRHEEATGPDDPWHREAKVADWERVIAFGSECLATRSKDLQIAAWITEGLAHRHGFAGVRDGFRLIQELIDRFWETAYPEIDGGDLDYRASPLDFLNQDKSLPRVIRELPLTRGGKGQGFSYLRWHESRQVDNQASKDPEKLQILIDEGKITGEQFNEAVNQTPRAFYESLNADLEAAWNAHKALNQVLDARFGDQAPSLVNIRKAMEEVRRVLVPILSSKRAAEPDEEPVAEDEAPSEELSEAEDGGGWEEVSSPVATPAARAKPRPRPTSGGPIADAEDAVGRILEAAAYLREHEPASPVPFAVVRAIRLAELYELGDPPDPASLSSPSSETRQELKRLAAEGEWDALLEQAEQALGRPEGRAWLDAHRYALAAMAGSGSADRTAALGFSRALLRSVLTDFPDLARMELADDTPTANTETRAWIESEIVPPASEPSEPPHYVPPTEAVARDDASAGEEGACPAEPDPWDLALADVQAGRTGEGLNRLRAAMTRATSGREKFRRKLQMAELCLTVGNHRVALPLLEELARRVDEFHLEHWEDESLCARVWGALYRALRDSGAESENGQATRLQEVYTRLCRLDINQAMSYDGG